MGVLSLAMLASLPAYVRRLIFITLGFTVVIGCLFLLAEQTGGYGSLTYVILSLGAFLAWAVICIVYAVVVLIRDGRQKSSVPAAVILLTALVIAGIWGLDRIS